MSMRVCPSPAILPVFCIFWAMTALDHSSYAARTLSLCIECTRALLSGVRRVGAFGVVVYSDDDDRSNTYAVEQDRTCPGCGASVAGHDGTVTSRRLELNTEADG